MQLPWPPLGAAFAERGGRWKQANGKAGEWGERSQGLDEPCPFKKATGRTWRQIAGNEGDKIPMNGKGPQVPRAYLHSIESWAAASEPIRLKAKLALALCGNEAGQ